MKLQNSQSQQSLQKNQENIQDIENVEKRKQKRLFDQKMLVYQRKEQQRQLLDELNEMKERELQKIREQKKREFLSFNENQKQKILELQQQNNSIIQKKREISDTQKIIKYDNQKGELKAQKLKEEQQNKIKKIEDLFESQGIQKILKENNKSLIQLFNQILKKNDFVAGKDFQSVLQQKSIIWFCQHLRIIPNLTNSNQIIKIVNQIKQMQANNSQNQQKQTNQDGINSEGFNQFLFRLSIEIIPFLEAFKQKFYNEREKINKQIVLVEIQPQIQDYLNQYEPDVFQSLLNFIQIPKEKQKIEEMLKEINQREDFKIQYLKQVSKNNRKLPTIRESSDSKIKNIIKEKEKNVLTKKLKNELKNFNPESKYNNLDQNDQSLETILNNF